MPRFAKRDSRFNSDPRYKRCTMPPFNNGFALDCFPYLFGQGHHGKTRFPVSSTLALPNDHFQPFFGINARKSVLHGRFFFRSVTMKKPTPPCKDCVSRSDYCHKNCTLYKAFLDELAQYNSIVGKEHDIETSLNDLQWNAYRQYHKHH